MSEYIPDPTRNFTPRQNPKKPLEASTTPIAKIDITDRESLRNMAMSELATIVSTNKGSLAGVPAIRELLDRLDGKPGQAITVDQTLRQIVVNANIEFIPARRDKLIDGAVDKVQVIDNE